MMLASNFLDDGQTIRILDWEYAAMGDLFFDNGGQFCRQSRTQRGAVYLIVAPVF